MIQAEGLALHDPHERQSSRGDPVSDHGSRVGSSMVQVKPLAPLRSHARYYLLGDHLGSTAVVANSSGLLSSEKRYMPWGEERYANGTIPTTFRFTGQREQEELGLYFYQSRWYDAALGRFLQADTIIPDPYNSQAWDRFAYALNAPTRYTDPTGHWYYDPGCDCLVYTGNPGNEYPDSLYYNENTSTNFFFPDVPVEMIGEFDPVAQIIISWGIEPLDWAMTYGYCKDEGCGLIDIGLAFLPFLPSGLSRTISKVIPQGQWHHILSTKIIRALDEHPTLRGVFDRGEALVQALDSESHRGYQTWHRMYDDTVKRWINNARNATATPEDFINYLISIYQNPAMQQRFPQAVDVLESLLESLP